MSPRITRLASDWKTYLAIITGITATITASSDAFTKLAASIKGLPDLPPQTKWVGAGVLAVFALVAGIAAWSRRSILLRPERFIVSAKDPAQLIGRQREIGELAELCAAKPLVFLSGESGTGKSALARAGLVPFLRQQAREGELLPIVLDASSLSWQDGLRIELSRELSRALGRLTAEERAQIKLADDFSPDDLFTKLGTLPPQAPRRLFLILDQLDDYLVAHRAHLSSGNTVLTPAQLAQANPDWAAVAALVHNGRLRLLLICRNDIFNRLDTFRFAEVTSYSLERIEPNRISPLLDQVTADDTKGPVIEHPEYGWAQLKPRLLRDLSGNTEQILPIQLVIALDSLSNFRPPYLTISRYAKAGGARGLERLHIQRHLKELAASRGLQETALLQGLMLLVTERGQKTQRATREAFSQAILGRPAVGPELDPVIEHLERRHILRRQLSEDGEYLLLHHDYLARGIWEAQAQANRWVELLRQRSREFNDALTSWQRWKALLPPIALLQLLWQRLRGRFRFAEHSAFAGWSLLRFAPLLPLLACLWLGWRWVDVKDQERFAEGAFVTLGTGPALDQSELAEWTTLSNSKEDARFRAAQRGLAIPVVAEKLSICPQRTALLAHALVGLDPTGKLSRRFIDEIAPPNLLENKGSPLAWVGVACAANLRLNREEQKSLATALVERMKTEHDGLALSSLGQALGSLSGKLEAGVVQPLAAALVARMKNEQDSSALSLLGQALGSLSGKLEAGDVHPLAAALVARMKTEKESFALSSLGEALGRLSEKLPADDIKSAAAALVERMKTEQNSYALSWLGQALGSLSGKLEAGVVQPLAAALVERMKTEQDSVDLSSLGDALGSLSGKLEAGVVQPLAAALVARMKNEQNRDALSSLGRALGRLSEKLPADDIKPAAAALVERMKTEQDRRALSSLGVALGSLSGKLQAGDVQPAAAALVARMKYEQDSYGRAQALSWLAQALSTLAAHLGKEDAQQGRDLLFPTCQETPWDRHTAAAWVKLEEVAERDGDPAKRVQKDVDMLALPLVVGEAREPLLEGLEKLTGEKFHGDLWEFVEWATTKGKALKLNLDQRPYRPIAPAADAGTPNK